MRTSQDRIIRQHRQPMFYAVVYRPYDSSSELHGKLHDARRSYLVHGERGKWVMQDTEDGAQTRWIYRFTKKGIKWKKIADGKTVQRTVPAVNGYGILTLDKTGKLLSRTVFETNHLWRHTHYYRNEDLLHPHIILEPVPGENAIHCLEYHPVRCEYTKRKLFASPIAPGTAVQSMVNSVLGEPMVCAATDAGDFCYCSRAEQARRQAMTQEIAAKEDAECSQWEGKLPVLAEPDFDPNIDLSRYQFNFTPEQMGLSPLLEEAEQVAAPMVSESSDDGFVDFETFLNQPESVSDQVTEQPLEDLGQVLELSMEETKRSIATARCETDDLRGVVPSGQPAQPQAYRTDRASLLPEQPQGLQAHLLAVQKQLQAQAQREADKPAESAQPPVGQPGRPTRYAVAVQKSNGSVVCTQQVLKNTLSDASDAAIFGARAAKRIVVSQEESYLYFGRLMDGLRQGRGRTATENGQTAYEGNYHNDQRDGFGVYYYKSGQLCYAGDWKENQREGVGVSYTPNGESIHVGRWHKDQPTGISAIFDGSGSLSFAGRIENGLRQGLGVSYQVDQDAIFIGKWQDDVPTGQGAEFDRDGNLRYHGMWKNGKRSGFGTEYSPEGEVVYTGQWEDDHPADAPAEP